MAEFSINGDNLDIADVTEKMGLKPTDIHLKGQLTKNKKNTYKETSWSISTKYEESYDINIQLERLMALIENKVNYILEIKQKYKVNILFMIVVNIKNNETAAMYLKKPIIHFMSAIDAEVGFDTYIYGDDYE